MLSQHSILCPSSAPQSIIEFEMIYYRSIILLPRHRMLTPTATASHRSSYRCDGFPSLTTYFIDVFLLFANVQCTYIHSTYTAWLTFSLPNAVCRGEVRGHRDFHLRKMLTLFAHASVYLHACVLELNE